MDQEKIEYQLYQIITGTHYLTFNSIEYKSVPNTLEDKHRASILYYNIIDDIKYDSMISWEEAQKRSADLGIWTSKDEDSLKALNEMLDNLKLELFLSYYDPDKKKTLKKKIEMIKKGIYKSNENKYSLYNHTKEYYASNIKKEFLIGLSIRDSNNNKVILPDNFWLSNHALINEFMILMNSSYISVEDIRKISRSEPWRSMWINQKGNTFSVPATEWTDQQRLLLTFSRMYDNVYESMDCPPDEVIEDDDMLDGWFIKQSRDKKEKQKEKLTNDKFSKLKNQDGQELFIMSSKSSAREIYDMNDTQGLNTIKSRNKQIKDKGVVNHTDLQDVQMDLRMQFTRETQQKMRNI